MNGPGPMDGFGMQTLLFSIFGFLYMLVALFIVVLSIVFIFKALSFMKRKTANDERLIQVIEKLGQNHVSDIQPRVEDVPKND